MPDSIIENETNEYVGGREREGEKKEKERKRKEEREGEGGEGGRKSSPGPSRTCSSVSVTDSLGGRNG